VPDPGGQCLPPWGGLAVEGLVSETFLEPDVPELVDAARLAEQAAVAGVSEEATRGSATAAGRTLFRERRRPAG
jgi:hypothetical protein